MKIYNTLTRRKEEFVPLEPGKVTMYVCGPTIYNYIHIGNARPQIVFDCVRRYFEYKGYNVAYAQNFTDVDDRIINKAIEENVTSDVISTRYMHEALADERGLNIKPATYNPKATEEIDGIIALIETLIEKGYAYESDGTVFFETRTFEDYGKLSKKNIDELEAGARIDVDEAKRSPADFVLWKPAKPGEPKWASPWSEGRPGWHIECSAMVKKYFGDTIDIHAGGDDLIFPHHENEIAQSECATGKPLATYWMHNGLIHLGNQKMAKSSGNFFTVRDIAEKFPYSVIRFFMLSAHYRSPVNFSEELMQAAQNGLERIKNCVSKLRFVSANSSSSVMTEAEAKILEGTAKYSKAFETAMEDDFNTADAVTAIYELVKYANINVGDNATKAFADAMLAKLMALLDIMGIQADEEAAQNAGALEEAEIERLIAARQEARKNKDFKAADAIRDELADKGVVLEDTKTGVRWSYKWK